MYLNDIMWSNQYHVHHIFAYLPNHISVMSMWSCPCENTTDVKDHTPKTEEKQNTKKKTPTHTNSRCLTSETQLSRCDPTDSDNSHSSYMLFQREVIAVTFKKGVTAMTDRGVINRPFRGVLAMVFKESVIPLTCHTVSKIFVIICLTLS